MANMQKSAKVHMPTHLSELLQVWTGARGIYFQGEIQGIFRIVMWPPGFWYLREILLF